MGDKQLQVLAHIVDELDSADGQLRVAGRLPAVLGHHVPDALLRDEGLGDLHLARRRAIGPGLLGRCQLIRRVRHG